MPITGKFRKRVTVQRRTYTPTDFTPNKPSGWETLASDVAAEMMNRGMGERGESKQTVGVTETLFRMRRQRTWTPVAKDIRLVCDGQNYYVTRVEAFNANDRVDIWTELRDNQQ